MLDFRSGAGTGDLIVEAPLMGTADGVVSAFRPELLIEDELEARGDEVTTAEAKEGATGAGAAGELLEPGRLELEERAAAAA